MAPRRGGTAAPRAQTPCRSDRSRRAATGGGPRRWRPLVRPLVRSQGWSGGGAGLGAGLGAGMGNQAPAPVFAGLRLADRLIIGIQPHGGAGRRGAGQFQIAVGVIVQCAKTELSGFRGALARRSLQQARRQLRRGEHRERRQHRGRTSPGTRVRYRHQDGSLARDVLAGGRALLQGERVRTGREGGLPAARPRSPGQSRWCVRSPRHRRESTPRRQAHCGRRSPRRPADRSAQRRTSAGPARKRQASPWR